MRSLGISKQQFVSAPRPATRRGLRLGKRLIKQQSLAAFRHSASKSIQARRLETCKLPTVGITRLPCSL
ncbi:hypothetical protein NDU88_006848 [Pleurodeles waltl]|uniref:Uncharacterized protein n=1 Tax=Pleurodeles waltl TaxID=8319 RepID=A0AAV7NUP9_PLEWA|nr:hypothetical protein NDU88_006848 [Pleurodeles waltl]